MRRPLILATLILLSLLAPAPARAQAPTCGAPGSGQGPLVLDGQFADWSGMPCIPDPPSDCRRQQLDLTAVWFGANPDDPTAYFMLERYDGTKSPIGYIIAIDTNNNGYYGEQGDRLLLIRYQPRNNDSVVDVELSGGDGSGPRRLYDRADLGESRKEGGRRVEVAVALDQLGISAGQAIRFFVLSLPGNAGGGALCDWTDEVQWSPANALGLLLLALIAGAATVLAHRRRRLEVR